MRRMACPTDLGSVGESTLLGVRHFLVEKAWLAKGGILISVSLKSQNFSIASNQTSKR